MKLRLPAQVSKVFSCRKELLFLSFFLLTLGNSAYFISVGINRFVEYAGLLVLLMSITENCLFHLNRSLQGKVAVRAILLSVLFCLGLAVQELRLLKKLELIISMLILVFIMIASESYIRTFTHIRWASLGILAGCAGCTVIALLTGTGITTVALEGLGGFGFNAGMEHKNFFAYAVFASFTGLYLYYRYEKKTGWDFAILVVELLLMVVSNSRSVYIVLAVFFIAIYTERLFGLAKSLLNKIPEKYRKTFLVVAGIAGAAAVVVAVIVVLPKSGTYMYRVRGLLNFFKAYSTDAFHMVFGAADMAFANPELSYNENIRATIGWDGSTEMALLNMLIKNGILGVIGYVAVLSRPVAALVKTESWEHRIVLLVVVVPMLVSTLAETFVTNVHLVYGPYCYVVLTGLCGMVRTRKKKTDQQEFEYENRN